MLSVWIADCLQGHAYNSAQHFVAFLSGYANKHYSFVFLFCYEHASSDHNFTSTTRIDTSELVFWFAGCYLNGGVIGGRSQMLAHSINVRSPVVLYGLKQLVFLSISDVASCPPRVFFVDVFALPKLPNLMFSNSLLSKSRVLSNLSMLPMCSCSRNSRSPEVFDT